MGIRVCLAEKRPNYAERFRSQFANGRRRQRSSSDTLHALTVALVKPFRRDCWNHAKNSLSAMLYTRLVIGDEALSSTRALSVARAWGHACAIVHTIRLL